MNFYVIQIKKSKLHETLTFKKGLRKGTVASQVYPEDKKGNQFYSTTTLVLT